METGLTQLDLTPDQDTVFVANPEADPILTLHAGATMNLHRVGMTVDGEKRHVDIRPSLETIAATAHNVNRAYCMGLGDFSQPTWEDAPQWQKDSAMAGVKAILDNPDTTPKQSHENWYRHKEAEGWVYGDVKDPEAKTHPCMVPYEQLPKDQQAKDYLFGAVVRSLM